MGNFLLGMICMGFFASGLFFLRFWRDTRDRLFLIFGLAFMLFAFGRGLLIIIGEELESFTYIYLVRLAGFLCIILAIVDKNRTARRGE